MADDSPFGDFSSERPLSADGGDSFDDAPIALPPPTADASADDQQQQQQQDDDEQQAQQVSDDELDAFAPASPDRAIPLGSPTEDSMGAGSPPAASGGSGGLDMDDDPFASVDGGSGGASGGSGNAFDSFSGGSSVAVKEEEAAALEAWEKERAQVLRERASKADADKQAALSHAREEIAKFYADRDAQLTKQQKTNRADEKNYRSDMKQTFESGARWEKVGKLISTQPKANEKAGQSRVDRMRKLLIQLKAEKK